MANEEQRRTRLYYAVRGLFKVSLDVFYSDYEVTGLSKFPDHGPVIVAANHSNSLVDAAAVLKSSPRPVRLTCKEPLLRDPFWGWFIRGVESIGLRRRRDHSGQKVDNTYAMSLVRKELRKGCCVGLFPEGIGRYRPFLNPLRSGVARTAVDFVVEYYDRRRQKEQQKKNKKEDKTCESSSNDSSEFSSIAIVPLGLTYFRREMFRSAVATRFGDPIIVDADFLLELGLNVHSIHELSENERSDELYRVSQEITAILRSRLLSLICTAESWRIRVLSEVATEVMFPPLRKPPSMAAQYVSTSRQFANALDCVVPRMTGFETDGSGGSVSSSSSSESSNSPTSSEIAGSEPSRKESEQSTPQNLELRKECVVALDEYWNLLYEHGICDQTVIHAMGGLVLSSKSHDQCTSMNNECSSKHDSCNDEAGSPASSENISGDNDDTPLLLNDGDSSLSSSMTCSKRISLFLNGMNHLLFTVVWGVLTIPGIFLWSPMYLAWRYLKAQKIALGIDDNYDKLAGAKMVPMVLGTPVLCFLHSMIFKRFVINGGINNKNHPTLLDGRLGGLIGFLLSLMMFLISMHGFPSMTFNCKHGLSDMRGALLLTGPLWMKLIKLRRRCRKKLNELVELCGISDCNINDDLDESDRRAQLEIMRRKWDWNHALRVYRVPCDRLHIAPKSGT